MEYIRALPGHLWTAAVDVLFVTIISLAPLLLARLTPSATLTDSAIAESYWGFLTNGQLAFYSMGSLAVMLLTVFRKKLPSGLNVGVGMGAVLALLFLAYLIGLDPKLEKASLTFVGPLTLWLFIVVQLTRIVVEAVNQIGTSDAFEAGDRASQRVQTGLANRKKGGGQ